jgi:hypothetical protein
MKIRDTGHAPRWDYDYDNSSGRAGSCHRLGWRGRAMEWYWPATLAGMGHYAWRGNHLLEDLLRNLT